MSSLFQKYNVPGPRYTSYPTVPYWEDSSYSYEKWLTSVRTSFAESNNTQGISLIYTYLFVRVFVPFVAAISISPKGTKWKTPI